MALRRQRLSQRRKAVGLTQESLAQRLGVERSTVARWEAGDTEPLPSIRPGVARALQVSIDELAELLTASDNASTTRALSADTEVTVSVPLSKFQSEVWLDRAEFEGLIRPQATETVEALRSDGASTEDLEVGRSSRVPLVAEPDPAEHGHPVAVDADPEVATALDPALAGLPADPDHTADIDTVGADIEPYKPAGITVRARGFAASDVPDLSSVTTIPLNLSPADVQWRRARSQQPKRFAAAGILALVGWAASVPFLTSDNGPIPPAAGNPVPAVPVAAIPAPNPGSSNESTRAPAAAPNKPADDPAPSGPAAGPASQATRSDSRSKPPASMRTPPPPRTPETAAEAYVWSRIAERLSESDQNRTRHPSEFSPHP